jgi:hypothetical protein
VTGVGSGDCGVGGPSMVGCVVMADDLLTLWRCRATGEGTRPNAWIKGCPAGLNHGLELRASARFALRLLSGFEG